MTNYYYDKLKRDIVKDVISLILIWIVSLGICAWFICLLI